MALFLFIVYFFAGCFFITRIRFIRDAGLSQKTILFLFFLKIGAGCAVGLVNHFLLHNATDYDSYNNLGIAEYHLMFSDPQTFFTDLFKSNYAEYGEFFGSSGSYWNDLRTNIIFKVLAVMNIFSRGNYYINSLFFNFFCFFGHVALYRIFIHIFPGKKWPVIIGCFLLPGTLYFTSGIHKDLIVFTALAGFCYSLYMSLECGFSRKRILWLIINFIFILAVRNFIALMLIPFAGAWFISRKYRLNPGKVFGGMLLLLFAGGTLLHSITKKYDPLEVIVDKQNAFFLLGKANTQYHNDTLQASVSSFVKATPGALRHAFISPYPGEFSTVYFNLFSVEMIAYFACLMLVILIPSGKLKGNEFVFFAFVFTFFVFLFSGLITPSAGALIRYRSIYFPLIITPLLAKIDWRKFKKSDQSFIL